MKDYGENGTRIRSGPSTTIVSLGVVALVIILSFFFRP